MFRLYAIVSFAILIPFSALAYSQQDVQACTPDAFRLCQSFIPDETRVARCLFENKRQLSPACKVVFSRPAAVDAATTARFSHTND